VPPLLANCPDVRSIVEALAQFHPLWGDDIVVLRPTPSGGMNLLLESVQAPVHPDTFVAFAGVLTRVLATLTGTTLRSPRLTPTAAPQGCFSSSHAVLLTKGELSASVRRAQPGIAQVLRGFAQAKIDALDAGTTLRVRTIVQSAHGPRTLIQVAQHFNMSPRTLQARLKAEGTSFATIADDAVRLQALALLATDMPVSAVAYQCGFKSTEGFTRAVRRWTGLSPTRWRQTAN
jgi:AraC-like DNA-binding protein